MNLEEFKKKTDYVLNKINEQFVGYAFANMSKLSKSEEQFLRKKNITMFSLKSNSF